MWSVTRVSQWSVTRVSQCSVTRVSQWSVTRVSQCSVGVRTSTSGVQTATPGAQTATPGAQTATSGAQTATLGAQTATPGTYVLRLAHSVHVLWRVLSFVVSGWNLVQRATYANTSMRTLYTTTGLLMNNSMLTLMLAAMYL